MSQWPCLHVGRRGGGGGGGGGGGRAGLQIVRGPVFRGEAGNPAVQRFAAHNPERPLLRDPESARKDAGPVFQVPLSPNPGSASRPLSHLSLLPQFPSESPRSEGVCFSNTQSQSGLGEESGLSRPGALRDGEPRRLLSDPILPSREGSRAPPTCKHRRAVGIADVGVRGADVLGVEDEDPQHDRRESGPSAPRARRGLGKVGDGRGAARGFPHWRELAQGERLGSLAPGSEQRLLKRNRPVPGCSSGLHSVRAPAALSPLVSGCSEENRGFCSPSTPAALPGLG